MILACESIMEEDSYLLRDSVIYNTLGRYFWPFFLPLPPRLSAILLDTKAPVIYLHFSMTCTSRYILHSTVQK